MNASTSIPPAPTFVVGVGDAGVKVLVELAKLVDEQGYNDYFEFIAIDSNEQDLNKNIADIKKVHKIGLSIPTGIIDKDKKHCPYLFEDVNLEEQGAQRQRVVGRYLIDNNENWGKVYGTLKDALEMHVESHKNILTADGNKPSLNIWLLHSLGGGTGSGTFPLLAAILYDIAKNTRDRDLPSYFFGGVGILPSAINPEMDLPGDPKYYGNAYAAMLELKEILSKDKLYISLYNKSVTKNELKVGRVFNKYFLEGINEKKLKESKSEKWTERYADEKNRRIANAIYSLHKYRTGLENWPIADPEKDIVLGLLGQREISVRYDLVKKYLELKQEKETLENNLKSMINDLNGVGKEDEVKKNVEATVFGKVNLPPEKISKRIVYDLCSDLRNGMGLKPTLYGLIFAKKHLDKQKNNLKRELDNKVTQYWIEYNLSAEDGQYKDAKTPDEKMPLLKNWLEKELIKLNKKLGSLTGILNIFAKNKRDRIEEILKKLKEAEKYYHKVSEAYLSIIEVKGLKRKIEDEISKKETEIENEEAKLKQIDRDLECIETELSKSKFGRVGYLEIPRDKTKKLTPSQRLPDSLADFVNLKLVEVSEVTRGLRTQIQRISDWSDLTMHIPVEVESPEKPKKQNIKTQLFVLYHEVNQDLVSKIPKEVISGLDEFSDSDFSNKYTISICIYFFKNVYPEYIQEYWNMHQLYENDKDTFSKIINMDVDSLGKIFAYPEWFPDDPNVQKVFTK